MNCRLRNAFAARIMMTRLFEAATCSPPKSCVSGNCLVPSGAHTASRNPRLRCQGQARGGRAIGHPDRRRHRSPESASVSGTRRNGAQRSRTDHRWYSLHSVVPRASEEGNYSNDLARGATKKAVAPASRRQFCVAMRIQKLPAGRRHYQTRVIFHEISKLTRSGQKNGTS